MKTEVYYRNRQTDRLVADTFQNEAFLRWLYEDSLGFRFWNVVLNHKISHQIYAIAKKSAKSQQQIGQFVAEHGINIEEIELPLSHYRSFNDFFIRKLKSGQRPFEPDPDVFCSPADAKLLVYPSLKDEQELEIKGASFTLSALLGSKVDPQPYYGGSAVIARLAPYDYHRFHFPDSGLVHQTHAIRGQYHSVNPIALARVPDVYCRNQRSVTEFAADNFGRIAYVEVGALTVASIVQTAAPGAVARGEEKGYFQFGGSTIVLLFEPNKIAFDPDLIRDSADRLEVHVLAGSKIGQKSSSNC